MRLGWSGKGSIRSFCVYKSAYVNGRRTTITVEKLGNTTLICEKYEVTDAKQWCRDYIAKKDENTKACSEPVTVKFFRDRLITQNQPYSYNVGLSTVLKMSSKSLFKRAGIVDAQFYSMFPEAVISPRVSRWWDVLFPAGLGRFFDVRISGCLFMQRYLIQRIDMIIGAEPFSRNQAGRRDCNVWNSRSTRPFAWATLIVLISIPNCLHA